MQLVDQLFIIAGVILGVSSVYAINIIRGFYKGYMFRRKMQKHYESELKKVEDFKKNGGMHKWVQNVAVQLPNGKVENTHVCEHTGYCPAIEGFIPVGRIRQIAEARKTEKEYQEYKSQEIVRITQQYDLPCGEVTRNLVEEILSMKKNFHIKKMEDYKNELKKQFGPNIKIVSSPEELKEALGELENGKS